MEEGIRALGPAPQGTGMMGREWREVVGEGRKRVKGRDVVSLEFENSAGREGRREEDTVGSEIEGREGRIGEVCKNGGRGVEVQVEKKPSEGIFRPPPGARGAHMVMEGER
ncbi:hypothetical protein CRENBAI_018862 [Crenichthys baileyi]|uniref:Uncharacterized protein n=1 Tax=Crenichthys baileyi TaxID=28760 RepID=A0AAV9RD14_9TELE